MRLLCCASAVAFAHIRVDPDALDQDLHLFFLQTITGPLLEDQRMLGYIPRLAECIDDLSIARVLHSSVERSPVFKRGLITELMAKPEMAQFLVGNVSHFQLVADCLGDEQLEQLASFSIEDFRAFNKLAVSNNPKYLDLLWGRMAEELKHEKSRDLGMILVGYAQAISALNEQESSLLALIEGERRQAVGKLEPNFYQSLFRWSPLASEDKRLVILSVIFRLKPAALLKMTPRITLSRLFEPHVVLTSLGPHHGMDFDLDFIEVLAGAIVDSDDFWRRLPGHLGPNVYQLDWRLAMDRLQDPMAKRNIFTVFLPILLNRARDKRNTANFLGRFCQPLDDFKIDCLIEKNVLHQDQSVVADLLLEDLNSTSDRDLYGRTLLALRFLNAPPKFEIALLKKTLVMDLGHLLSFDLLLKTDFGEQVDDEMLPLLINRLIQYAPSEVGRWERLFSRMSPWMPTLIPFLLSNHADSFFKSNAPTKLFLDLSFVSRQYFVIHGVGLIGSNPSIRSLLSLSSRWY